MKGRKKVITLLLLGGAIYFGLDGWRNYRLTEASYRHFEHPIHLDQTGRVSVIANLPGRSIFRPGGILEFKIGNEQSIAPSGKGMLKVVDGLGSVALEANLEDFNLHESPKAEAYLRSFREFETTNGGPYEIIVDVTEAFRGIKSTPQILIARHFISGTAETVVFLISFGITGLMLLAAGGLILRNR